MHVRCVSESQQLMGHSNVLCEVKRVLAKVKDRGSMPHANADAPSRTLIASSASMAMVVVGRSGSRHKRVLSMEPTVTHNATKQLNDC